MKKVHCCTIRVVWLRAIISYTFCAYSAVEKHKEALVLTINYCLCPRAPWSAYLSTCLKKSHHEHKGRHTRVWFCSNIPNNQPGDLYNGTLSLLSLQMLKEIRMLDIFNVLLHLRQRAPRSKPDRGRPFTINQHDTCRAARIWCPDPGQFQATN